MLLLGEKELFNANQDEVDHLYGSSVQHGLTSHVYLGDIANQGRDSRRPSQVEGRVDHLA